MSSVGIRDLKQNASAVVARAAAGEIIAVTDRGRPVAQLTPLPPAATPTMSPRPAPCWTGYTSSR